MNLLFLTTINIITYLLLVIIYITLLIKNYKNGCININIYYNLNNICG